MVSIKITRWFLPAALVLAVFSWSQAPAAWERPLQPSLTGGGLTCLSAHPSDAAKFFVANRSQLFEGSGAAGAVGWKPLWSTNGRDAGIQKILAFPWIPEHVFLLTADKIFMGKVGTNLWKPVYDGGNRPEKAPFSFVVIPQDPNQWFVGTSKGLWTSPDAGKTWSRAPLFPRSNMVTVLFAQGPKLFIGDETSLYLSLNGSSAQEVLSLPKKETSLSGPEDNQNAEAGDATYYIRRIHAFIADESNPQHFFAGTHAGVFESADGGYRWRPLSRSGMRSQEALDLAYDPKTRSLFAATPKGVCRYQPKGEIWDALSEGIAQSYSKSIAVINGEKLIAVTGDGFLECPIRPETGPAIEIFEPSREALSLFRTLVELEPTAREVHQKVIRYADVGNGKINRWHIASRVAGLLPTFSFGKNLDRNASVSTYSGKFITGPEDVSRGWDADVSWDLGDAIYSSDQTSIDSREKMMVELRQDLLSEATRVYFERRRLQTDIVYTPSLSEQEHLERLIRMDELTALLDGMTDGFLSRSLERIYEEKPELNELWIYQNNNKEEIV